MRKQHRVAPARPTDLEYTITGASSLPDSIKKELAPLRQYVRADLIKSISQSLLYIQTGSGSKKGIVIKLQDSLNLLSLEK